MWQEARDDSCVVVIPLFGPPMNRGRPVHSTSLAIAALCALVLSGCTTILLGGANLVENRDAPRREIAYGTGDRQTYDVYRPLGADGQLLAGPLPVVIFVHGGSWKSGSKSAYRWVGQGLAAQGFLAVLPNYGLMPTTRFPAFVDDVAAAVAHVRARVVEWGGDTTRLFLMGHSAGAQISALVAYDPRYLAKQGIAPSVFAGFIGLSGPYDFVLDTKLLRATFAGTAERERDAQPVNFVHRDVPRTLLAMGRDDRTVDPRNTTSLAAHLRAVGASVEEVWVDGTHGVTVGGFARPNRGDSEVLRRVRAFILDSARVAPCSRATASTAPSAAPDTACATAPRSYARAPVAPRR